jgi:3-phenylpropionate/cinnamic acid dioxygenase small subunit
MSILDVDVAPAAEINPDLISRVTQLLALEAKLLDEGREEEWFQLLDEQFTYRIPSRQATEQRSDEVNRNSFRVRDTKAHIRLRINRLATGASYSEIPPSRTMRLVGSILVEGVEGDVVRVCSSLLVYRQRGIDDHFDLIPCRRNDTMRRTGNGLTLLSREVLMTEVGIATPNLGIFL